MVNIHIRYKNGTWDDYFNIEDYRITDNKLVFNNSVYDFDIIEVFVSDIDRLLIVNEDI